MAKEIGEEVNVGNFHLDANHEPFIRVADGGSSCSNCLYLRADNGNKCSHKDFIKFMGSDKLPDDVENYCSDWYEPAPEPLKRPNTMKSWLNKRISFKELFFSVKPYLVHF